MNTISAFATQIGEPEEARLLTQQFRAGAGAFVEQTGMFGYSQAGRLTPRKGGRL